METFSASLAICAGNSPVTGEFPAQRPVTRSFDVFFDLRLILRLNKNHQAGDLIETISRPLWRHPNVNDVNRTSVCFESWNTIEHFVYNAFVNMLFVRTSVGLSIEPWTKSILQTTYSCAFCWIRSLVFSSIFHQSDEPINNVWACDYLPMLGLKLIHVSKMGPWWRICICVSELGHYWSR